MILLCKSSGFMYLLDTAAESFKYRDRSPSHRSFNHQNMYLHLSFSSIAVEFFNSFSLKICTFHSVHHVTAVCTSVAMEVFGFFSYHQMLSWICISTKRLFGSLDAIRYLHL